MNRKRFAKPVGVVAPALTALGLMVPAAQAETPAPGYEQFKGCPTIDEDSAVSSCIRSVVDSGYFKVGSGEVPISKPIEVRGGVTEELEDFQYNSEGGLPPVTEQVPGGLVGLTGLDWLTELLNVEQLKLYAVTELAGQAELHSIFNITLPIKVHLINSVLGNTCDIGSTKSPIVLNLTTGTSGKLTGKTPHFEFDFEKEILHVKGGTYVDNEFTAPGAEGCALNLGPIPLDVDSALNLTSGLPAASGTNETVQNIETEVVEVGLVYP
jgi:hypothetical protein